MLSVHSTKWRDKWKQITRNQTNSCPFIILEEFNCHSTLWGCKNTNQKGKNLETSINNNNLCIYNNKSLAYLCPFSGSYSAVDFSLSDPSIFSWTVMKDTYGSDHFPICLQNSELSDKSQTMELEESKLGEISKTMLRGIKRRTKH